MREIKFRAWDDENNCMVKVSKLHLGKKMMVEHDKSEWNWYTRETPIMQFTGLTDKNGKEIYEGDIVTYGAWDVDIDEDWRHSPALVEYKDEKTAFYLTKSCNIHLAGLRELEVLGNIYENPELINS